MSLHLVILTNGRRDYLQQVIPAALRNTPHDITTYTIIDDSGDPTYRAWLQHTHPLFDIHQVAPQPAGFSAAMQRLHQHLRHTTDPDDTILHIEDDMLLTRPLPLDDAQQILHEHDLLQMAFKREPWYGNEHEHGGVIEAIEAHSGADFVEVSDGQRTWIEHRHHWTCNPSIYPAWVTRLDWPPEPWSESAFSREILELHPAMRSAYWGSRDDEPYVRHIGVERTGHGY